MSDFFTQFDFKIIDLTVECWYFFIENDYGFEKVRNLNYYFSYSSYLLKFLCYF